MKILCCVKVLPSGELNPFDAAAYEAALRVEGAEVMLLSMGRENTRDLLYKLTRLGAKRAILLTDPGFAGADSLATAYALSEAVKKLSPDLILCGRQSIDGDTAQVGPEMAEMLSLPLATCVYSFSAKEDSVLAKKADADLTLPLPALLTLERSYDLRLPSIFSRPGEVETWNIADLGADPARCGTQGSRTRVIATEEKTGGRRDCHFISPAEFPKTLSALLQKETVTPERALQKKLPFTRAVGNTASELAESYFEEVETLPMLPPPLLAEKIAEKEAPVLFASDVWGRENAPRVAAILSLGLCADCTSIEERFGNPVFVRPAFGESKIAHVRCLSPIPMATMRPETVTGNFIVSLGRGCVASIDRGKAFAARFGAELASSRGLVDDGKMPYPLQVGMTGRIVSPKVYLAIGISGAVHHLAGMERSGSIIAVNPDKNAPIFDHADVGILSTAEEFFDALGI